MTSIVLRCFTAAVLILLGATPVIAQEDPRMTAPRMVAAEPLQFVSVRSGTAGPGFLRNYISVDLSRASVEHALRTIAERAGLELTYSPDLIPEGRVVSLRSSRIQVGQALQQALAGTDLDVLVSSAGKAALVRRPPTMPPVSTGTVTGTVRDAETAAPVATAEVRVEGTRMRTVTSTQGRYILTGVPAGLHQVSVRRIGYEPQTQDVTVVPDASTTLDFVLAGAPTFLDGVVATVTGEQRIRELGHVVGQIRADSVVRASPVSNISELLTARIPGVQVFSGEGTVGGDAVIRIRGSTTSALSQEPIVIVDGVRYNGRRNNPQGVWSNYEPTSRLNDLNPNDIESIEVVKGPSAATLYGTDAVNGVIVITTKQGQPGRGRWNAYVRSSLSEPTVRTFPNQYRAFSSTVANCTLELMAQAGCAQDSVRTIVNPLNDEDMTIFAASSPRWEIGTNVSGSEGGIRYFLSADFEEATGQLQMPPAVVEALREQRGMDQLPRENLRPNAFTKINLRSNVTADVSSLASVSVRAGFTRNSTRTIQTLNPYRFSFSGTETDPYGTTYSPERVFLSTSTETVERASASARLDARPSTWLAAWATLGIDLAGSDRKILSPPGSTTAQGVAHDVRRKDSGTTADIGLRTDLQVGSVNVRTAVGAQYVRSLYDGLSGSGNGLPLGGQTPSSAANQNLASYYDETATLGGYVEQTLGLNERLFLIGAVRADGATTFGRDYRAAVYPKLSASWILSEEPFIPNVPGLDEMRLRYAFGVSGRQPTTLMPIDVYIRSTNVVEGQSHTLVNRNRIGNPDLRPERTREWEFGFDAGAFGGRIRTEATWYMRTTIDGIRTMSLPPGFGITYINVGEVRDRGFESQLTLRALDRADVAWDISLLHSSNQNRLVSRGDVAPTYSLGGGLVEGYPIGARFMTPLLGYEDRNGDGIIDRTEVIIGDSAVYMGRSDPSRLQTLHTMIGLFAQRLRLSALLDRRAGYTLTDGFATAQCSAGFCRAAVDPGTSLDVQAQVAALGRRAPTQSFTPYAFVYDASFIRLREIASALDLPSAVVRPFGARSATLNFQARNLALWTNFRGVDVESVPGAGRLLNGQGGEANGIPTVREWILRLDLGF